MENLDKRLQGSVIVLDPDEVYYNILREASITLECVQYTQFLTHSTILVAKKDILSISMWKQEGCKMLSTCHNQDNDDVP